MNLNTYRMQKLKGFFLAVIMLSSVGVMAQAPNAMPQEPELKEDFKKEELQSFVKASSKIEMLQMGAQENMVKAVESEGLTVEKFNTMAQAQQDPEAKQTESTEDQEMFNKASQKIMDIQKEAGTEIQETIKKEGIDVQTYEQIMYAYQNSENVKGELDKVLMEEQQKQAPQQ